MAESGLSATINTLRLDVGLRHGWGRSVAAFTNTMLTDFDNISLRALREFYFPPIDAGTPSYEWTFLRKAAQITLATNTAAYDLPDDFGGTLLDDSVTYASGVSHPPLRKVPESTIRKQQAQDSTSTGWPKYFAVRNKVHTPTTGQRWELLTYQTPGLAQNAAVLDYRYVYVPDALSNTNIYPVGGAQYSEVITAAHLAAAELVLDGDPAGPYRQQFVTMLATAMRNDLQQKANEPNGGEA
jgi:hypothetical protein